MSSGAPAPLPHLGLLLEPIDGATGELTATLGALTCVATGGTALTAGSLAKTLGAVTVVGAATSVVGGTTAKTLAPVTLSSLGSAVSNQGSLDAPVYLPHMAFVLYEIQGVAGYVSKTLENVVCVSYVDVPGNEIWPYDNDDKPARAPQYYPRSYDISWFQTATPLRDDTGGVVGVVGSNLQPLVVVSSVEVLVEGVLANTLDDISVVSESTADIVGVLDKTLDTLVVLCAGSVNNDIVGTLFSVLEDMTCEGIADGGIGGVVDKTLEAMTCTSAAAVEVSATLDKTLQGINANIDGSVLDDIVCVVIQTLGDLTCRAEANNGLIRKVHGGIGKPAGKARRRYVTIDGEDFVVESDEQAQALIDAAQQLAEVQAKSEAQAVVSSRLAVAKASETALDVSPVSLDLPVIKSDNDALLAELNAVIGKAYKRAEVEAEIAVRLAKQRLEDEEDNLVLLLLNE